MSILDNIENPDINSDEFLDMILSIDSGQVRLIMKHKK